MGCSKASRCEDSRQLCTPHVLAPAALLTLHGEHYTYYGEQVLDQRALSASISSSVVALLLLLLAYRLLAYLTLSCRLRSLKASRRANAQAATPAMLGPHTCREASQPPSPLFPLSFPNPLHSHTA